MKNLWSSQHDYFLLVTQHLIIFRNFWENKNARWKTLSHVEYVYYPSMESPWVCKTPRVLMAERAWILIFFFQTHVRKHYFPVERNRYLYLRSRGLNDFRIKWLYLLNILKKMHLERTEVHKCISVGVLATELG